MNVVIYARFSSHSQTEQSIEGQLKVCYEFAAANDYTVVGEYIDRAQSGTSTDNRQHFLKMIADSDKHTFEGVLVYQLDRLTRNRYDIQSIKRGSKRTASVLYRQRRISAMMLPVFLWRAFSKVWLNTIRQSCRRRYT